MCIKIEQFCEKKKLHKKSKPAVSKILKELKIETKRSTGNKLFCNIDKDKLREIFEKKN